MDYNNETVVDIHRWAFLRMDYFYWKPELIPVQLGTEYAQQAVRDLGAWGSDALFGLLWRYAFDFSQPIRESVMSHPALQQQQHDNNNPRLSLAIHSRHAIPSDTGCNLTLEQQGILDILQQHQQQQSPSTMSLTKKHSPCQVTIVSDRSCTVEQLANWVKNTLGCQAIIMQHQVIKSVVKEHGPFSRAGFFQDMLLAGMTARDGMVGSLEPADGNRWRSSSELVEELIAYYRTMEHYAAGQDPRQLKALYWSTVIRGTRFLELIQQNDLEKMQTASVPAVPPKLVS